MLVRNFGVLPALLGKDTAERLQGELAWLQPRKGAARSARSRTASAISDRGWKHLGMRTAGLVFWGPKNKPGIAECVAD